MAFHKKYTFKNPGFRLKFILIPSVSGSGNKFYTMKNVKFFACTLLTLVLVTGRNAVIAQVDSTKYCTNFLHIKNTYLQSYGSNPPIRAFVLESHDSQGNINWFSKRIVPLGLDEDGYLLKVNLPDSIMKTAKALWCNAYVYDENTGTGGSEQIIKYGGVKCNSIKLLINSAPSGAESYLISNRVWMERFKDIEWQNADLLSPFKVDEGLTNTHVFIDETVYVIVFKLNNSYKQVIHRTRPFSVDSVQTVFSPF
jgi:hypothetical protein